MTLELPVAEITAAPPVEFGPLEQPLAHADPSHSSGKPFELVSLEVPFAMSQASGIPFSLHRRASRGLNCN